MKSIAIKSIAVAISLCSAAKACPMCRDAGAVSSGGGGNPPSSLFNASILSILVAFLIILGALVAKLIAAVRLADRSATSANGT